MELINPSKTDEVMAIVGYEVTGGTKIPAWKAIKPGKKIEVSEDTVERNLKAGLVKVGAEKEKVEEEPEEESKEEKPTRKTKPVSRRGK